MYVGIVPICLVMGLVLADFQHCTWLNPLPVRISEPSFVMLAQMSCFKVFFTPVIMFAAAFFLSNNNIRCQKLFSDV